MLACPMDSPTETPEIDDELESMLTRLYRERETSQKASRAAACAASVPRNNKCPCGSGLKAKKCCGSQEVQQLARRFALIEGFLSFNHAGEPCATPIPKPSSRPVEPSGRRGGLMALTASIALAGLYKK